MSQRVAIDYDEVEKVSQDVKRGREAMDQEVAKLTQQIGSLQDWTGQASTTFKADWEEASANIKNLLPILDNISQELHVIAENFRAADTGAY